MTTSRAISRAPEFYWLLKKAGVEADFVPYVEFVETNPIYRFEPIVPADLHRLGAFGEIPEMHDRLIVITGERLGATIVTRDASIHACTKVRWV